MSQTLIRAFLAIEIPEEIRQKIYQTFARLHRQISNVKWVEAPHMHLSLRFLGELELSLIENEISPALEKISLESKPLHLTLQGVGLFSSMDKPRVFWLGVGGELVDLKRLYLKIEKTLQAWPIHVEEHDFHPHITLGRVKQIADRKIWQQALEEYEKIDFANFRASTISLFKSELTPTGPIYTRLQEFSLQA